MGEKNIYIYGDKPEYYLHGNRLQYVHKATTGSKLKLTGALFLGEILLDVRCEQSQERMG